MKKIVFIAVLAIFSLTAYAQVELSSVVKLGYQTGSRRVGVALDGRYAFQNNIRIAPEIIFFIPKNHITGLDLNLDIHYLIPVAPLFKIYPLIGMAIDNNYYSQEARGETYFGFNLGAGGDYDLDKNNYLNAQFRYTFNKYKYSFISLGYGFKF